MYSRRYSPYSIDLSKYLSEDHMNMYSSGIAPDLCTYNGKWVGLAYHVSYTFLYCNIQLLNKYEKDIPKTWDELIETGKFILTKEQEDGNIDLVVYNGLFPESETLFISTQEFIYSFRETKNSKYPKYDSIEAINALNKLKEIKNEIASDNIFQSNEVKTVMDMIYGKAIFLKFWNVQYENPTYKKILLLGNKEGISSAGVGGLNVGINNQISDEKIKAAVKAVEFFTSKEIQKKKILEYKALSAIQSLYTDEDVCKVIDCEVMKNLQPIARPGNITNNYDEYSFQFRNYINEFLYENKTAEETLNNIINILKIYNISINPSLST
eukprot:jgi/Orpsp1_1/1181452/evm.model.c7180000077258.1